MSDDVIFNLHAPAQLTLPIASINAPFALAYHGANWEARLGATEADDKIVPTLLPQTMQGGVNGIGESLRNMPDGGWNFGAIADVLEKNCKRTGAVMLPLNEGPKGRWYVVATEARAPGNDRSIGKHFHCRWESLFPGSDHAETDPAVFDEYVEYWRSRGLIPARPSHDIVMKTVGNLAARLALVIAQESGKEGKTTRRANLERELAAWRAIEAPTREAAAADTKKRKPVANQDVVIGVRQPAPADDGAAGFVG